MSNYAQGLAALRSHLVACQKKLAKVDDTSKLQEVFVEDLRKVCNLLREAERACKLDRTLELEDWNNLVSSAEKILDDAIDFAYGTEAEELFDFLPSYSDAPDACPMVEDELSNKSLGMSNSTWEMLMHIIGRGLSAEKQNDIRADFPTVPPSDPDAKPHPLTSRIARFRNESLEPARTIDASPRAQMVYQARCESYLHRTFSPVGTLCIAESDGVLAMVGCTGYKQRDPALAIFDITGDKMHTNSQVPGLVDIAYQCLVDDSKRLVVYADSSRIKTAEWSADQGEERQLLNKHTFDSRGDGPMVIIGQNLIRAGSKQASSYNLFTAPTHGPDGDEIIGEEIDLEDVDTWRDVDCASDFECSSGSKPDNIIRFADGIASPKIWKSAPMFTASTVLSGTGPQEKASPTVLALDFESEHQIASKYLGHGGGLLDINQSHGDPNTFITACGDGYARLYDKRHTLPVMTFNATNVSAFCGSALSINPDGLPLVITDARESVKVWDVRAKSVLYELATGNNEVASMVWDSKCDTLYAAVECRGLGRMGDFFGYRKAKIPAKNQIPGEEWEEDEDEYDDGDAFWEGRCWPQKALHDETYFDYTFDAGRHGILRYKFKGDPNPKVLPTYGDADMRGDHDAFF